MDIKAIFSPKHQGRRTYGCRTKNQARPRGILIQKNQNKLATFEDPENTNFSLSDDSNDLQEIKDNKRKAPSSIRRKKGNVTPKQRQPRKTGKGRVTKKQLNTSSGDIEKQKKRESQSVQEMKPTPKHGLDHSSQVWVKTKVRDSDSDEDSIELPRRDQDMTWQEKISLLMPKMTYKNQHQPDGKGSGFRSGYQKPGYSVLNLSAEEVVEEDDESSNDMDNIVTAPGMSIGHAAPGKSKSHTSSGKSKGQTRPDLLTSRLSLHSPSTLQETECIDEKQENRKEHFMSPIDPVTSEDYTYTYEWVTDTGGSCPSSHLTSQVKGRDHTSQTTVQSSQRMSSLSKENVKRKSSPTEHTNSDAYTYDWVTDSGSRQTGPVSSHASKDTASQTKLNSCPSSMGQQTNLDTHDKSLVRISQNLVRSETKHKEMDRKPHGYFNSTKRPGALSIFHAKFPVDLSVITSSPSQGKEKTVLHNDSSPITAGGGKQVQRMNSTRKKDGLDIDMMQLPDMSVIERMCPLEKQSTCMDHAKTTTGADKVPVYLSSTRKTGGLDFEKANFSLDVSEIKELSCVEVDRQGHIQLLQENTPKARQTKQDAVTPMKSASVITKKKRKLLPKSSTVLFVSGYTGELIHPTPSLSAITSSQNTVYTSDHPDIARDGPVKKAKTGSGEKQLYIDSGPNSIWKEECVTQGKILTSTPVASTQTRFQRPEVNLTCVPRQCFEDELEFNESIEVNSDEIVPEDFTEEDLSVENLEKSSGARQKPELNSSSSKIDFLNKSVGSALQTSKTNFRGKLSVKPITSSSMISKMTECCLVDPSISFPRRKYTLYRKISEEMFKGSAAVSEDILLTHSFKRR